MLKLGVLDKEQEETMVKKYLRKILNKNWRKINLTGQSTQGYAIAKENVAIKLNGLIEKEGIKKILGLNF